MGLVGVSHGHHHVVVLVFPIQHRHQLQWLALAVAQCGLGESGPDLLQALTILFIARAVVGFQGLRVAAVSGLQPTDARAAKFCRVDTFIQAGGC